MKEKILKISFIILPFLLSFLVNFIYEWIPFPLFSIYSPVNESIFEHIKLIFTPLILTYLIFFFIKRKEINLRNYLSSLVVSICVGVVSMLVMYYSLTLAFNEVPAILNILLLLVALIISQSLSLLMYKKRIGWSIDLSIYILITMTVLLIIFTINPPLLDFFIDKSKRA